jgi:hypothetical protein
MKPLIRKSFGLGAVLALLAGPALAQPYYNSAPAYAAPYHGDSWYREHREAMWRAHERHEAWLHATHGGYGYGYHHDDGRGGY